MKDSPVKHALPSTGMAARALYDLNEAVELDDRNEQIDALLENDADGTRSPVPPVGQNAFEQVTILQETANLFYHTH